VKQAAVQQYRVKTASKTELNKMIRTTIFPGCYLQGPHALQRLGVELARFGIKGFVICDAFVHDNLLPDFLLSMEQFIETRIEKFSGECSDEEITRLSDLAKKADSEFISGIGGGKTLDTAKAVAYNLRLPVAIVPSI
jgi:glycerol dehydrogenase